MRKLVETKHEETRALRLHLEAKSGKCSSLIELRETCAKILIMRTCASPSAQKEKLGQLEWYIVLNLINVS